MNKWLILIATLAISAAVPVRAAAVTDQVKVYEGTRKILTGPFQLKGLSPQQRPNEFKPVEYPAVFIENQYLRCCVLPTVGGRLYEVYNKATKSDLFFVNAYLETLADDFEGGHPWNLGGVEVNFPYFHHGNSYNDRWQWAKLTRDDGAAGVSMSFTSRPTMQRAVFQVMLRPGVARVDLSYRFENQNPYSWGIAAWIDTMHPKTLQTQFLLPAPWVAGHGHNVFRTNLESWPIRNGIDLSWQKNVPDKTSLSEFAFMPRLHFHGCYEYAMDRGAVRIFDPQASLPAAKLWTEGAPPSPERYYQHFEIWTATSAVMEDPGRQAELSAYTASDSWYQVHGIGGYVFANTDAALNLIRNTDGTVLAGVCGTRKLADCVVSLRSGHATFFRQLLTLDPAVPWKVQMPAPAGDIVLEVTGPDGASIASYELRTDVQPQEQWTMPQTPRWKEGLNAAYHDEDYSTLWRRRNNFLDGAIGRFKNLLKAEPASTKLMLDLARVYLKDEQVRVGYAYNKPGPEADADVAKRRAGDLDSAIALLRQVIQEDADNAHAHLYLGLALERLGKASESLQEYRAALNGKLAAEPATMYVCRQVVKENPAEAVGLARRATQAYPQSRRAKHLLMVSLLAAGNPVETISIGQALQAQDPSDPVTVSLMGRAYDQQGKDAEAKACADELERLRRADPGLAEAVKGEMNWLTGQ